jgi:hypothetical protein
VSDCISEPSNSVLIDNLSIGGHAIKNGHFTVFPNPMSEQLIIKNDKFTISNIIIVDVLGKEVVNLPINNLKETAINVAKMPAGVYQLRIKTDNGIYTTKIVKQ